MKRIISLVLVLALVQTLIGSIARGGIVFLDDFEDGSATDGAPVTWTPVPSATGSFEVIDGDYVLTRPSPIEEMYCYVNQYTTLADTSIRTQARLIPGGWWLGLFARGNLGEGLYISVLKNNGKLEIWRFGASYYVGSMLASANVGIDPRAQDVLLRFDVIGNELSAWAWREGDPMPAEPQVTAVHSEFSTGGVGLAVDLGSRLSNNEAIFRYVEAYESISPTPDFNGDSIVDATDMCMMIDYWGTDESLYDIAPLPFGDSVIDVQDLIVLVEHLFEDLGGDDFGGTVIERRISASSDDAEEALNPGFTNWNYSSDLELVHDRIDNGGSQLIGLTFRYIDIAPGEMISNAYIEFVCDEIINGTADAYFLIWGHLTQNPDGFVAPFVISDRPKTEAKVSWEPDPWDAGGQKIQTVNVASIIQELIDQEGWDAGNAVEIIIGADPSKPAFTGVRCAESYDGDSSNAPLLHIETAVP